MGIGEHTYQIERSAAGWLLTAGAIAFLVGAFLPIIDKAGTMIYALPAREWPAVIRDNSTIWLWANSLFIAGALVAAFGAALLSDCLRHRGDDLFSRLGGMAVALGSLLLVIEVAFRLSVSGWAQEAATNIGALDLYVHISDWLRITFIVYSVLTLVALATYGLAILRTNLAPRWSGWVAAGSALLAALYLIIANDLPPFLYYLVLLVIGVLLLRPSRTSVTVDYASHAISPAPGSKA